MLSLLCKTCRVGPYRAATLVEEITDPNVSDSAFQGGLTNLTNEINTSAASYECAPPPLLPSFGGRSPAGRWGGSLVAGGAEGSERGVGREAANRPQPALTTAGLHAAGRQSPCGRAAGARRGVVRNEAACVAAACAFATRSSRRAAGSSPPRLATQYRSRRCENLASTAVGPRATPLDSRPSRRAPRRALRARRAFISSPAAPTPSRAYTVAGPARAAQRPRRPGALHARMWGELRVRDHAEEGPGRDGPHGHARAGAPPRPRAPPHPPNRRALPATPASRPRRTCRSCTPRCAKRRSTCCSSGLN